MSRTGPRRRRESWRATSFSVLTEYRRIDSEKWLAFSAPTWAAEPTMEDRKRNGAKVLIFLVVLTGLLYAAKRKIWADVH